MKLIPLTLDEGDAIEAAFLKAYAAHRALGACGEPRFLSPRMRDELANLWVWSRMNFADPAQMSKVLMLTNILMADVQNDASAYAITTCSGQHIAALQALFVAISDCVDRLVATINACADREAAKGLI